MSGRQILAVLVMAGGGAIAGLVFVGVMALVQSLRGGRAVADGCGSRHADTEIGR